jgi:signal transduction histidine kinase
MKTSRLYVKDILQNFISNGIKYTQKGSVEVTANSMDDKVIFAIKDTGIGVTKAEISKLFQKFWRSEDIHTRETEGTGLGLYIAAKLAGELGAKIDVQSIKGKGSTFSVAIPTMVQSDDGRIEVINKENASK